MTRLFAAPTFACNKIVLGADLHIFSADVAASIVVSHDPTVPTGQVGYFKQGVAVTETLTRSLLAQSCLAVQAKGTFVGLVININVISKWCILFV